MSFGFGVGDFIAVGQMAYKLYHEIYVVARTAPKEVRDLCRELSTLRTSIELLNDEVNDPGSMLMQCGKKRLDQVIGVMEHTNEILKTLRLILASTCLRSRASRSFAARCKN